MADSSTPPTIDEAKRQTETLLSRFSLLVSLTPPISALLISLSSDSLSTTWMLWVATSLCIGSLVVVFLSMRPFRQTRNVRSFVVAAASSALVLGCAWAFAFRDEIRFSRVVSSLSTAPAIQIEDNISRSVLATKATGAPPRRLASFINDLVQEHHRTRICALATCGDKDVALAISGVVTDSKFSLEITAPQDKQVSPPMPILKTLSDILAQIDTAQYLLENVFETGTVRIRIVASPQVLSEVLKTAYHLSAAVRLARDGDAKADSHMQSFMELVHVLSPEETSHNWILDGVLFTSNYYLRIKDFKHSLEFVRAGLDVFPNEPRLKVAEAYIRLNSDGISAAPTTLIAPAQSGIETSLVSTFRGVLAAREGDFWEAAHHFENATKSPDRADDLRRSFALHAAAAMLASMTSGDPTQRGASIVEHAERAYEISHDAKLMRLLTGFGYALKRNDPESEKVFDSIRHSQAEDSRVACDYWRARAYAETGREDEALGILKPLEESSAADAQVLGLLAELTLSRAANRQTVEKADRLARRALQMDPAEVKSNRVLGLVKFRQSASLIKLDKESFEQQALSHFQAAVHGGGADPDIYLNMSDIYRDLAKATPSRQSSRKSRALACNPGGDALSCRVLKIQESLDANNMTVAIAATNDMLQWLTDNQGSGNQSHQNGMLVQVAIAWYEFGNTNNASSGSGEAIKYAEHIYKEIARNLEHSESFAQRDSILATVNCNLGFIYVDQNQNVQATRAFKKSLQGQKTPDCEAGLAIALKQAGQDEAALTQYRIAKRDDSTYENIEMLRTTNFWSGIACDFLAELSRQDKQSPTTRMGAQ
jgi:tetratricopeptide (TPR) repeat protein